ncbi:MAG TPA: hypothetical protein VGH43_20145 [Jatrophihabitans sp.]|jgi:hypothetical protein
MSDHNHIAGQGAVLVDIGDDVGALIVHVPMHMATTEIEICPLGEPHDAAPRSHVGVHARPATSGLTAVFPALLDGEYELYVKPDGPRQLVARVHGGRVSEVTWPPG